MIKTYEISVKLMLDPSTWEVPDEVIEEILLPPIENKVSGRPRKKRQEKAWASEPKTYKTSCGQCRQEGHNRRTYRNMPIR
ncbi:hypothetical protein H5410_061912 [Solanum commersonii]|uniref:Uncharacterized protein n=1 Tax=Solanum commersonii TaxID=4109 RepID=A0A9J5W9B9_SOLCO|nr:hypothetical protein H5410_061912 [Solanum commersonii]